ncbi:ADP-ribosylation factor GTPase activating protein [Trypanosoma theileri]|uniref:ADP-ribosylation factor GTPase activating protein n=1 Tax=Trypanosoma theileri TaxID=67003 RepID=A0A1X0P3S6_9TRYP|nr:ADP-ribosylation factor GTPase activating protein [Trypanosoma theileri]ORC91488.1 ADP-ribosylation factor GTPase activating protein [Trypanosoma theileri]
MNLHARKLERNREEVRKLSLNGGNRFCMDCGMRGPLYVVINFRIFVCTTCAALHRSLQHKVKGISMTEFTDGEVIGLRLGGNDRAAKIWLHNYKRNKPPSGNVAAIKDFIINVFDDRAYLNREELAQFQSELKTAINTNSDLPSHTTLPPPQRSVSQQEKATATPPQSSIRVGETPKKTPTKRQTQTPESPSLKKQDVHSVPDSQIDFFTQSTTPQEPQHTTLNTSNDNANDDLFGDFFTAAAPPTSSTQPVPSAQETVADLFASAPPTQVQNNVMYPAAPPGTNVMYTVPSAPQMYPPGTNPYPTMMMPTQPGMQNYMGMNQGGYGYMPGVVYPNQPPVQPQPLQQQQQQQQYFYQQQQQQQQQFVHPMAVPTAPSVFNKGPGVHDQQSFVGGVPPPTTNNTNFFQTVPTAMWENPTAAAQPTTEIKGKRDEQDSNVFASLNPFGSAQ